ncbi:MAG: class I SAM-dependent methyltransferase [Planctomycetes bacterium]|nr:class I SAM-dependent methyltransferase [Planctomycetota bacterium]
MSIQDFTGSSKPVDSYLSCIMDTKGPSPLAITSLKNEWITEKDKVLSFGSGSFTDERYFAEHGIDISGIEENSLLLSWARMHPLNGMTIIEGDVFQILPDISKGYFNKLYARYFFHYFKNSQIQQLFFCSFNLLPLQGEIIIQVPSINHWINQPQKRLPVDPNEGLFDYRNVKPGGNEYIRNLISIPKWKEILNTSGFVMVSWKETTEDIYREVERGRPASKTFVIVAKKTKKHQEE